MNKRLTRKTPVGVRWANKIGRVLRDALDPDYPATLTERLKAIDAVEDGLDMMRKKVLEQCSDQTAAEYHLTRAKALLSEVPEGTTAQ